MATGTSGNLVEDNFIGTDSAGDTGLGNSDAGVAIYGSASSNTISGNTISDNGSNGYGGVDISGADDNVVESNAIVGNDYDGVDIFGGATDNTIGGTVVGQGNTISENNWGGVDISGSGTSGNVVVGNYIGTDANDDPGMGNGLVGVTIFGGATDNEIGTVPVGSDSMVGPGVVARTYGNTIVSNGAGGVDIEDSGTSDNSVVANFIGTDASGDTDLGNVADGVLILDGATDNTIGGTAPVAANTIADNTGDGVGITASGTSGNVVEGNFIGTNASSATNLGNSGNGVQILNGATTTRSARGMSSRVTRVMASP